LEEIEINKGYSSSLLGANTLGGAIQVRTARPKNPIEASLKTSVNFDSILQYAANTEILSVGSKLGFWYGKATFQYRDIDHYRLPASFIPFDDKDPAVYGNPQKAGDRFWSDSTDYKLTLLTGFTPLPNLDLALTYIMQIADKGFSPPSVYGGIDGYVIWDWPRWDRHSLSLSYAFDDALWYMTGFTWYGKYDNRLDQYYNWRAYMRDMHLPHSDYDEYAWGTHLEGGYTFTPRHELKAALTFKQEDHKGIDGDIETAHISEDTWSFGAEYSSQPLNFLPYLRLVLGLGFDALMPQDFSSVLNDYMIALGVNYYIVKSDPRALLAAQAGVFYDITPSHRVSLTYARKNHFPTMSQRYSTRYGEVLPNPRLKAEFANHFEFAYGGYWFEKLRVNSAVYYSEITGKIVSISIADPISPSSSVDYSVNLDRTATYGFEQSLEFFPFPWLSAGGAFSLNKYKILHSQLGMEKITYYPETTFNLFAELTLFEYLTLIPSVLFTGERYVNVEGTETLGSYALCNLKATVDLWEYFSLSLSVENIFDVLYEIRQHFPLEGRSFSLVLTAKY
jgi:iron complex outermembrane receptor protein